MLAGDPAAMLKIAVAAAEYASARGLVDDEKVLDRIAALQGKPLSDLTVLDQQQINKIANALMKRIGPDGIDKIHSNSSGKQSMLSRLKDVRAFFSVPGSIFAICIVLILVIIPLTTLYNRLTISIAELRDTEQQDFFYIMYQARALAGTDKAKSQSPQDFQNSLKKLRELESKINVNNLIIASTIELSTGTPKWFQVMLAAYGLGQSLSVRVGTMTETASPPAGPTAQTGGACSTDDEACQNRRFATTYGLNTRAEDVSGAYFNRRQAESAATLLGGSMLPVLFGFLGASVHLLRRYMGDSESVADPNLGMRAYLRLGLGGIAGLAIGWFWTPSSAKAAMDVANLGTAPFALAFLAGFSIELLFSILDRILAAVNPNPGSPHRATDTKRDGAEKTARVP